MTDILYKLFREEYRITIKQGKEQLELSKRIYAEWDKIAAVFGDQFVDNLLGLEGELEQWRTFQHYCAGFRLGGQLMLEAMGLFDPMEP